MGEKKRFKDFLSEFERPPVQDRLKQLMEKDSYDDLVDAIHNPKISLGAILRALNAMGFEASKSSLHRWRLSVKI